MEIKLSATLWSNVAREIAAFQRDFGDRAAGGDAIRPGRSILLFR